MVVGARGGLGAALTQKYRTRQREVLTLDRAQCDLTDPAAVERTAAGWATPLSLCVFSAGASEVGYVDQLDTAAFRRCLEVNFLAPATLMRAWAGRALCRRFVFILSGAADILVPGLGPYALAKRALRDYLYLLRLERSLDGVYLLEVWPGPMETPFDDKARVHGDFVLPRTPRRRSPDDVADEIVRAEEAGRTEVMLSPVPRLLGRVQSVLPQPVAWLIQRHPKLRRRVPS